MIRSIQKFVAGLWRYRASRRADMLRHRDLDIGFQVRDEQAPQVHLPIPHTRRAEHIGILGKTGTGKSSLLRFLLQQDITAGRGFVCFDLHGDLTAFLLATIAAQERAFKRELSDRLIVVEPADEEYSVGLNPLERRKNGSERFVQIAEFAHILRERWHLE